MLSILKYKELIFQVAKRNIDLKYKGSMLGILWSFLNPLFLLTIYTFVFGFVFKAKWGDGGITSYPVILFSGLIFHFLFIELLASSTQLISSNSNYVKKVVFPLEVLIFSNFIAQFFNFIISFLILIVAIAVTGGDILNGLFAIVIIAPPFAILCIGLSYLFSSLGVFIKDIVHIVNMASTLFLFASPILFPIDSLPSIVQYVVYLNPISYVVNEFRNITFGTGVFSIYGYVIYSFVSLSILILGRFVFLKLSRGFSDVV